MEKQNQVEIFYDNFNLNRKGVYRNLRHYKIINLLFNVGLNRKSHVLEIGCGSGPISIIVANYLKKGYFLGMDISPASIKNLNELFKNKINVDFVSKDVNEFYTDKKFDIILMADVLEHIPIEIHEQTIKKISENCKEGGILIINIPNAEFINWQKENEPNILQIIDQPLSSSHVCGITNKFNFVLQNAEKHKLFHETEDYEIFIFKKQTVLPDFKKRTKIKIIITKQFYRLLLNFKLTIK